MRGTLRQLLTSILNVNWARFEGIGALRCTIGVAIPLIAGVASGSSSAAVFGTMGAFGVGFGSFQGAYRSRTIPMVLAALGMAVSVFIGTLAGHSGAGAIVTAGLWGFGGGLLVALGPAASFVGLQSIVAVLIASGFPADLESAAARAAFVFGGGLAQTLLVVLIWPLRRFSAERKSLARVFDSLATYARAIPAQASAPEPHTLAATRSPLDDPQPFARIGETLAFDALLDEAERIRASLAALALHYRRLLDANRSCAGTIAQLSAEVLTEVAAALTHGREPRGLKEVSRSLSDCAAQLAPAAHVEPLLGQLHTAWKIAGMPAAAPSDLAHTGDRIEPRRRRRPVVRDALVTLRANLSLRSTACRHALRLAVTMSIAEAAPRVFEIPRGYWLPLTVAVMLRPDFHDTFETSVARVVGTVLGAVGAIAIAHGLGHSPGVSIAIVLAFVWAGYALAPVNAVLFAVCITGYVVFVMTLAGIPESSAAIERIINTVGAGALALCAYVAWPTWTAREMRAAVATMFDEQATYLRALLTAYESPASADVKELDDIRAFARRARSNAEAIIERTFSEPYGRRPMQSRTAMGLLAANRRIALAALALHAGLQRHHRGAMVNIEPIAQEVDRRLRSLATGIREGSRPPDAVPLSATRPAIGTGAGETIRDEISTILDGTDTIATLLRSEHDGDMREDGRRQ